MRKKRILSFVLALALCLTLIPSASFATASDVGTGNVPLYLDFLGRTTETEHGNAATSPQEVPTDLAVNDILWFGLRVEDMTSANWSTLADRGVYGITMGFNYDADYIAPYLGDGYAALEDWDDDITKFQKIIKAVNIGTDKPWIAAYDTVTTSTNPDMTVDNTWAEASALSGNVKQMGIQFQMTSTNMAANYQRFYQETASGNQYLVLFPMQVKKLAPAAGRNVIETALGGKTFVISVLTNKAQDPNLSGSWDATGTSLGGGATNMKTVFTYQGDADVFPVKYTLTFHDNNANLPGNPSTVTSIEGQKQMIQHDMSAKEYAEDGLLNAGKKPVVPGYVFKHWTTDTAAQTDPTGEYTPFTVDTKVTADTDLYAVYGEGYSITFDPNGGAFADNSTDVVEREFAKGSTITADQVPANPTRTDDYAFAGWNTAANGSGDNMTDADAVVAHDFNDTSATLYAQWEPTSDDIVTVVFNDNFAGASTNTEPSLHADPVQVNRNDVLASKMATDPKRGGYSFRGWNTVQNGTGDFIENDTPINPGEGKDTLTVYAQWEILGSVEAENKVTITFHADDADEGTCPDPIVLHKNDRLGAANLPANPTRTGRAFNYWAKDSTTGEAFDADNTVLATDVELYAVWKEKVTITFDARTSTGATVIGSPELTHELDAGDTVPDSVFTTINTAIQAPTGYTFNGKWNTAENGAGTEVNNTYKVENTVTAYAVYEADSSTAMDVTFDLNHTNVPNVYETRNVYKEETIHKTVGFPADPEREGYSFSGWYTEAIGGEKVDDTTTKTVVELAGEGTTSLTLYAHWGIDTENGKTEDDYYTVSFYSNTNKLDRDAADQLIDEIKVLKGEKLIVGAFVPTREGFDFADKWNDATGTAFDFDTAPTADTKLYAIWKADLTFAFDETPIVYTGSNITATITTLTGKDGTDLKDVLRDGTDYKIVYSVGSTTTADVINVGEYDFALIDATEDHTALGLAKIVNADELKLTATTPDKFAVNPGKINFELTEAGSQVKSTDGNTEVEPSIGIVDGPDGIGFTLSYSKWVDAGEMDKKIEESELTALGDGVKPREYGKYVVTITLTGDDVANYEIGELTNIALHDIADGSNFAKGSNIQFEVKPSAELTGIKFAQKDSEGADLGKVGVYEEKDLQTAVDTLPSTGGKYYAEIEPEATTDIVLEGTLPEGTLEVEVNGKKLVNGQDGITITSDENGVTITGVTLNPATGESTNDGFDNTIKITVGGTTVYEVEVCQLVAATIKLAPANSPYGLIERMAAEYHGAEGAWDADTITAAKEAFNEGNKFTTEYLPDGGNGEVEYTVIAWDDENLDRNDEALFAIIEEEFNDPGFVLTDSKGNVVELSATNTVTRKITWDVMTKGGQDGFYDSVQEDQLETLILDGTAEENTVDLKGKNIKPGIYTIEYTYSDGISTVTETRTLIVLPHAGDVTMDNIANSLDANAINQRNYIYDDTGNDPAKSVADARVFYYRTADVTMDNIANSLDANAINQRAVNEFYSALSAL